MTYELVERYTIYMTYELVELDADGNEDSLLAEGSWESLTEAMEEAQQDNEDAGGEWLRLRIQPAS